MQNGQFRTSCCSRVVIQFWCEFVFNIAAAGLVKYIFKYIFKYISKSSTVAKQHWRTGARRTQKPKTKKKTNGHRDSDDRLRDFPEWLQESAHISQDSDSERPTKVASTSRKQSICTHFPKDRNCDICLRTKIAKALCRRRTGEAVRRAEKFGDLKTADHKVLHEESESRNNHRYAVVVEDRATQWIQSCPCKTKTSPETENTKVPRAVTQTQVIYTDNSSESGTSREDLSWTHRTSAPHRSETGGVAERAVRRVKEGTSFSSVATIKIG